jgi:DNA-binding HxlR family transcriptional regulator
MDNKSKCGINMGLEVFGDRWTLLIIRDLAFEGKRSYREFLNSDEKIATNILGDRLEMLEKEGIVIKKQDPNHKQKMIYILTEKGIDLIPIVIAIGEWSLKYKPVDIAARARAKDFRNGGEKKIKELKQQLMKLHKKEIAS